jgi:formylglycine-generating enzyme required for sulfatase activity
VEQPEKGQEQQRLRAAAALARYDPDSRQWDQSSGKVVEDLVSVNAVYLGLWSEAFRPVKARLLSPLSVVFRDHKPERTAERTLATNILADYAADEPLVLADLLLDADEKQFVVLYPKYKDQGEATRRVLYAEVDKQLPADAKGDEKEKLAKRQANAAVALLRLGQGEKVWPLLRHSPDPRARSYLIHRLGPMGADARTVVQQLEDETEVTIRRALVLSLGEYGDKVFEPSEQDQLLDKLRNWYRHDPDPGLHAAVEWLLRQWKQDQWKQEQWLKQLNDEWAKDKPQREQKLVYIRQELAKGKAAAKPQWYVNGQGQTMVVIPGPVEEFLMGSPLEEAGRRDNEALHRRRIGRTFAIAAKPVTVEQFLRFREDHNYLRQVAPTVDCPVHYITWYLAAEYCNWLSEQEGISKDQWCYEPNPQGQYSQGMKLKANYLHLTGYRLPTEAEMEYECRAETVTSRYYGESEELLGKYGVYAGNSGGRTWPVGSRKPNDFGLVDMHGNVWCWCQERWKDYAQAQGGKPTEDIEDILDAKDGESRVLRGGSFVDIPLFVRSAVRTDNGPAYRGNLLGFRPARTFR